MRRNMEKSKDCVSEEDCYIRMTELAKTIDEKITKIMNFQFATFFSIVLTLVAILVK